MLPLASRSKSGSGDDEEAKRLLFDWSMAEFVEHYLQRRTPADGLSRPRRDWHQCQPVRSPEPRRIRFHHSSGRLGGMPGMWGYVKGGMGMVSFYFCDAAREAGAMVVAGRARRADRAGRRRDARRRANASPRPSSSRMPTRGRPCACWAPRPIPRGGSASKQIPIEGCTVKLNVLLRELPELHRAARHQPAASLRPDQHAAHQRRVESRICRRAPRRTARASLVRALFPERARSSASPTRRSTP